MKPIKETIQKIRPQKETVTSTSIQTKTTENLSEQSALTGEETEGRKSISFQECLRFLEERGKTLFGNHFKLYEEDHSMLFRLMAYFIKDTRNSKRLSINLNKGVLLTGPIGTGKTSLMTLMRYFLPRQHQHIMKSTRDITFEFIKDGFSVINRYSHDSHYWINGKRFPKIYCFDDLGIESNIKYYGNHTNVMAGAAPLKYY